LNPEPTGASDFGERELTPAREVVVLPWKKAMSAGAEWVGAIWHAKAWARFGGMAGKLEED